MVDTSLSLKTAQKPVFAGVEHRGVRFDNRFPNLKPIYVVDLI
jgi:hypothetical protein